MSYNSLVASATVVDSLNGSTISTVSGGTAAYRSGGPFGRQLLETSPEYVAYVPTLGTVSRGVAIWFIADGLQTAALFSAGQRHDLLLNVNGTVRAEFNDTVPVLDTIIGSTYTSGQLCFAALTYNSTTNTGNLYVNSTKTTASGIGPTFNAGPIRIGQRTWGANPLAGALGSFVAVGGTAWTDLEVEELRLGPEPLYVSGSVTLNEDLTYESSIEWNTQGNGTVTEVFEWYYYDEIQEDWIEPEEDPAVEPINGREYRLLIYGSNNGGYDADENQVSNSVIYQSFVPTFPELDPPTSYVQPAIEYTYNTQKQMAETNGEIVSLIEAISPYAFLKRRDTTMPSKTRDFDFSNKYKRGH